MQQRSQARQQAQRHTHLHRPWRGPRLAAPVSLAVSLAVALAVGALCSAAHAGVATTGSVAVSPGSGSIGPGNTNVGNGGVIVGAGAAGSLTVNGGSLLQAGALIGASGAPSVSGTVLVTGAGSRIELNGDPTANNWLNRLEVGAWGHGSVTVADGASLDTTLNLAVCANTSYCSSYIGNFAGADATLAVTGAGSSVSLLRTMYVGGVAVFAPPQATFTAGTPGGATTGRVSVTDGATLRTDSAQLGLAPGGSNFTGSERSFAEVAVSGTGALWRVTGGTIAADNLAPSVSTAGHRNAWATLSVDKGGTLRFEGNGNVSASLNLTNGGGRTDATVNGAGSSITFAAESGILQVGRSLGSATLDVRSGGVVSNVWYTSVGRDGSFGTLNVDGAGSVYSATGTGSAAAAGNAQTALVDIGRGGGNGVVNITAGGRLEVIATTAKTTAPQLSLGRDAASAGTLKIDGAGSTVFVSAASVAPGSGEAFNPIVRIGRDGSGTLTISNGGKLIVEGNALSTVANTRRTNVYIGGSGDTTVGGHGIASITGAGSELRVSGADAYLGVGHGPQAVGSLTVSSQAAVSATILGVGNLGGSGVARLDNAGVQLSGQYTGSGEFSAALVIGAGAGAVGNVAASNGTLIRVATTAANGGGVTLGGSRSTTGGDGTLTLNASSLVVDAPLNNSALTVGRSGSGLLRAQAGSTIDLGGNLLYVGRDSGSDGTLIASGGSTISAGFVGVGATRNASGQLVNGGTGTLVLNGATLNAQDVFIGSNGYLGGSAGAINVSGSIVNHGIFSPGASPGVFTVNGNFSSGSGSRLILEVESDGQGGFRTDDLRFGAGSAIDLAALTVEFRFLGDADPNAFQAGGGFRIDSFIRQANAQGVLTGLAPAAYSAVTFSAQADGYVFSAFTFSAAGGATFTAAAVPEPAGWALWLAAAAVFGLRATQRRRPA